MMECNKEEAIRARDIAEKKMQSNDFEGARRIAMKAQQLFPELENINKLLTVCNVHCASQSKILGSEKDFYGILQLDKFADEVSIKKQYRKLAFTLHPDKNKLPGAEAAFKFVGEANALLLDPAKKALYDNKCKVSVRQTQTQSQFSSVNRRQTTSTQTVLPGAFWTVCPFCKTNFQYLKKFVNHLVPCQKCTKAFTAYELNAQGVPNTLNMGRPQPKPTPPKKAHARNNSTGRPSTQGVSASWPPSQGVPSMASGYQPSVFPPKDTPHAESSRTGVPNVAATHAGLHRYYSSKTARPDFGVARSAADGVKVKSDSKDGSNQNSVAGDKRKGMSQKKEKSSGVGNTGSKRKRKHEVESSESCDTDSEDAFEEDFATYTACPDSGVQSTLNQTVYQDSEFTNFDKEKEAHCFAVDQIWALYDTLDGMPRFYAAIKKVFKSGFKLRIKWLEADPEDDDEISWATEKLPFGCGRFQWGDSETTSDRLSFSHQVHYKIGKNKSIFVYPQKGEIWALIKDWNINWNTDPENHKKYKYELVEVVSDYSEDAGIRVSYLDKVKGLFSLFQRANVRETDFVLIRPDQMLRFSHRIPSAKMTGTERAGVPVGSFELDPASLPEDPDDICYPLKATSDNGNLQNGNGKFGNGVLPGKNADGEVKTPDRRSPRAVKTNGVR